MSKTLSRVCGRAEHFKVLHERISRAKREVQLVSPWIVGDVVLRLLDSMPSGVEGSVTFRWPSDKDDPTFYDTGVLKSLLARPDLEVRFTCDPLHAKIYAIDQEYLLITSANLTGSGFPDTEAGVGNIEAGVELQDPIGVGRALGEIESCALHVLDSHHLSQLEDWVRQHRHWRTSNSEIFDDRPKPDMPHTRPEVEIRALEYAKQKGWIAAYHHVPKGLRRKAYRIELGGGGTWRNVRVLRSVGSTEPSGDYLADYHFNINDRDVADWKQRREPRIHGLVLVPVSGDGNSKEWSIKLQEAPVAFLPLSEIFQPSRFPVSKFLRAKHANYPGLYLSQKADGSWVLRLPAATKHVIPVDNFLRSTRRMRKARKNWANRG
jgi:hypothetical protein